MPSTTIFYGAVINPLSLTSYSAFPRCLIAVDGSGNIGWIVDDVEPHALQEVLAAKGHVDMEVLALKDGEFIMPGFIDTHTVGFIIAIKQRVLCNADLAAQHAPQVPNMGTLVDYFPIFWCSRSPI